jgi:hypothetical protein
VDLAAGFGVRSSQRCFRLLLAALANPRLVFEGGAAEVKAVGAATVALALADIGAPVAVVGDKRVAAEVAEATRAPLLPVPEAQLARGWPDGVLGLRDGRVVADCRPQDMDEAALAEIYRRGGDGFAREEKVVDLEPDQGQIAPSLIV